MPSNCLPSGVPSLVCGSLRQRPSSKYGRLRPTRRGITTCSQHWTRILPHVCWTLSAPPHRQTSKYKALKERLVDTFGLSKRERASRLLHTRPLGDSKPSVLMDEMLALLGDHPPCMLFEQLFLERLPEDIRVQLVDTNIEDHRELARKADALWAAKCIGDSANAILQHQPPKFKPKSKPKDASKNSLCYYHRRFGEAARQCRDPCTWSENEQAGRT